LINCLLQDDKKNGIGLYHRSCLFLARLSSWIKKW